MPKLPPLVCVRVVEFVRCRFLLAMGLCCRLLLLLLVAPCASAVGCAGFGRRDAGPGMAENPIFVSATDRDFLWNALVDTVDDYFTVQREERVRMIGEFPTPGRIDTRPQLGATYLEPWRKDSSPGYEKLHATLQTIRRQGTVHVTPTPGGYLVEVIVTKELEDLQRPEQSTVGASTLRHDGTLVRVEGPLRNASPTLGWIALGRDTVLEQRILSEMRAKLTNPGQVAAPLPTSANAGAYVE